MLLVQGLHHRSAESEKEMCASPAQSSCKFLRMARRQVLACQRFANHNQTFQHLLFAWFQNVMVNMQLYFNAQNNQRLPKIHLGWSERARTKNCIHDACEAIQSMFDSAGFLASEEIVNVLTQTRLSTRLATDRMNLPTRSQLVTDEVAPNIHELCVEMYALPFHMYATADAQRSLGTIGIRLKALATSALSSQGTTHMSSMKEQTQSINESR